MKDEEYEFMEDPPESPKGSKCAVLPDKPTSSPIGIRPRPCRPGNVAAPSGKSEPINKKKQWAPGAWQDDTRTSAFQPYKPPTLLTNLQRGNTQTEILLPKDGSNVTFYTLAGQGSIDIPDENGLTALMWAAGYGQLNSVRLLLKAGADKDYRGSDGQSALHFAAAYGHHDVVKMLLNHGADPNASEDEGNTPLIYGAQGDHPHVCHELLTRGANLTATNVYGLSAYKAAILKNSTTAKAVIDNYLLQKLVNVIPEESQQ
ncbi:DNA-binding protein RFXANK-like isoform X2 [Phymastichus coffea]|uniref:DNA-binding protein RFXANK-like isoform X2 n=1 Tax=Phymastichus coffea TaxID=108790 RepID=UPI00273C407E|nr:DNA-binding protein RFXANK-like isoform X2 [Phymastichus coffea]